MLVQIPTEGLQVLHLLLADLRYTYVKRCVGASSRSVCKRHTCQWIWCTIREKIWGRRYTHTPKSSQRLRLTAAIPNQNARHDPCPGTDLAKPLSPLETLALTSLDQTIMVLLCSIRF